LSPSASVTTWPPPLVGIFLSAFSKPVKKASHSPSGEKNGNSPCSVPASVSTLVWSSRRNHSGRPGSAEAIARKRPSSESASEWIEEPRAAGASR
jgi:hypothetical protein